MRRSHTVTLTLLPMLATAAVAAADPLPTTQGEPIPDDPTLAPPGLTEPELRPPGLAPIVPDCEHDPSWRDREECLDEDGGVYVTNGVIRGGFGHYFWTSGG